MDRAIDQMWLHLGIGPTYMKERHGSTFTAECHVRYLREIHLGDPVRISVYLLAADEKRLHTFEELRHATEGWISATSENMTIHIDMNARKTAPFPSDIRARIQAVVDSHAAVPRPEGTGRQGRDALEIAHDGQLSAKLSWWSKQMQKRIAVLAIAIAHFRGDGVLLGKLGLRPDEFLHPFEGAVADLNRLVGALQCSIKVLGPSFVMHHLEELGHAVHADADGFDLSLLPLAQGTLSGRSLGLLWIAALLRWLLGHHNAPLWLLNYYCRTENFLLQELLDPRAAPNSALSPKP